jgi:hypothetical protein
VVDLPWRVCAEVVQVIRSPGWQLRASQILVRLVKRIARAWPFFKIDRFTIDMPACSASSVRVISRSWRRWSR